MKAKPTRIQSEQLQTSTESSRLGIKHNEREVNSFCGVTPSWSSSLIMKTEPQEDLTGKR